MSHEYHQFNAWLSCEFAIVASNIIGSVIFLFCRSLVIDKVQLAMTAQKVGPETDYLEAQALTISILLTFNAVKTIVYMLSFEIGKVPAFADDPGHEIGRYQSNLANCQFYGMLILIFSSFRHPPFDEAYYCCSDDNDKSENCEKVSKLFLFFTYVYSYLVGN